MKLKPIRAIHPFGPAVGTWKSHGTVDATIKRKQKELREAEDRKAAEFRNIFSIKRG